MLQYLKRLEREVEKLGGEHLQALMFDLRLAILNKGVLSYAQSKVHWEKEETLVHRDISAEAIRASADSICRQLSLHEDDVVLDIGCGDGRIDEYLATKCKTWEGFDFSANKLEKARQRVPKGIFWSQSFLEEIILPKNSPIPNKLFSNGVMQYCRPEDINDFFQNQINLCSKQRGEYTVLHFGIPDIDKAYCYYRELFPALSEETIQKRRRLLRVIWSDASYWHDVAAVKKMLEQIPGVIMVEVRSDPKSYRSDIILKYQVS